MRMEGSWGAGSIRRGLGGGFVAIGVLVGAYRDVPAPPEELPMGRAALHLEREGVPVLFGHEALDGELIGLRARPGGWEPARSPVVGAHDRFPSRSEPERYARLLAGLGATPTFNRPSVILRCADKQICPDDLTGPQPEVEADPERFEERLRVWGLGFLKPRYGAFGVGVRRVLPGDPLPAWVEGPQGLLEPALLQRGISPPRGWAGVACRVLVQRDGAGWWAEEPVARVSATDAVVNAARGASVLSLSEAFPSAVDPVRSVAVGVAADLERVHGGVLELGVDVVLDGALAPWIVEVNARPRGRLEALVAKDPRWMDAHIQACLRPWRAILAPAAAARLGTGEEDA
jgi:glutathione synthase/RimK-type ligase-like ATP-grasp enzyme